MNRMLPQNIKISSKELERLLFIEKNYERIIYSCIEKKLENQTVDLATNNVISHVVENMINTSHENSPHLKKHL